MIGLKRATGAFHPGKPGPPPKGVRRHDKAFAFFGGTCTRGICDSETLFAKVRANNGRAKTALDTIFVGKERAYNRVRHCLSDQWRTDGSP